MYYTGIDPRDGRKVYVCRNPHEKAMQRALIQYRNPKNYDLVYEALTQAGRTDLIGYDKKCLIRPRRAGQENGTGKAAVKVSGKAARNVADRGEARTSGKAAQTSAGREKARNLNKGTQERHRTFKENGKKKTIRNIHKKKGG